MTPLSAKIKPAGHLLLGGLFVDNRRCLLLGFSLGTQLGYRLRSQGKNQLYDLRYFFLVHHSSFQSGCVTYLVQHQGTPFCVARQLVAAVAGDRRGENGFGIIGQLYGATL